MGDLGDTASSDVGADPDRKARALRRIAIFGVAFAVALVGMASFAGADPFPNGAHAVPGSIEAENYDSDPTSFSDTDLGNHKGAYRSDDVDIWPTVGEDGFSVGRTRGGEYLEYTIDAQAGSYDIDVRVATGFADPGTITLSIDGVNVGLIDEVPIAGWWSFSTVFAGNASIAAGEHVVRLEIDGNGQINIDRIDFTPSLAQATIDVPAAADPVANGQAVVTALGQAAAQGPTAQNRVAIRLAAGVYEMPPQTVVLPDGVDIIGRGQDATTICYCHELSPLPDYVFTSAGSNRIAALTVTGHHEGSLFGLPAGGTLQISNSTLTVAHRNPYFDRTETAIEATSADVTITQSAMAGSIEMTGGSLTMNDVEFREGIGSNVDTQARIRLAATSATMTEGSIVYPFSERYQHDREVGVFPRPSLDDYDVIGLTDGASFDFDNVLVQHVTAGLSADASCTVRNMPVFPDCGAVAEAFSCAAVDGLLSWAGSDSDVYWIYKSTDDGATYNWLGRWKTTDPAPNPPTFTDPNPAGARYQVRQPVVGSTDCTTTNQPSNEPQLFSCAADAGTLTWTDTGSDVYWIYKSTDGGATFNWLGRWKTSDAAPNPQTFTDPNPSVGARYQIHQPTVVRTDCTITNEPNEPEAFSCAEDAGTLTWTDAGSDVYWIYKSTDGGATFNWLGRWKTSDAAPNPQTFTDPNPTDARYQVRMPGAHANCL